MNKEVREMKRLQAIRGSLGKWASRLSYAFGILTIVWPTRAFAAIAAGGALPWDTPLTTLQTDLQGPVAHAITTAAVIGTGIMWSVSEHGTGVRKMSSLAFGGACALGATQLMTTLFPMGGALF
jgi:type IV secretion system protein TrbC